MCENNMQWCGNDADIGVTCEGWMREDILWRVEGVGTNCMDAGRVGNWGFNARREWGPKCLPAQASSLEWGSDDGDDGSWLIWKRTEDTFWCHTVVNNTRCFSWEFLIIYAISLDTLSMIELLCQTAKHCISLCSDKESISASVYRLVNFYDVIIEVRRLKHVA